MSPITNGGAIDIDLTGFKELDRKLAELPNAVAGRQLSSGLRAGANVIAADARARVPRGVMGPKRRGGHLADQIVVRIDRKARMRSGMAMGIGFLKDGWYGLLVELGTAAHVIRGHRKAGVSQGRQTVKKRGQQFTAIENADRGVLADASRGVFFGKTVHHPGAQPKPFLRPALDAKGAEAIRTLGQRLWRGIERLARTGALGAPVDGGDA